MKKKPQINVDYFMRTHMGQMVIFSKKFERKKIYITKDNNLTRTAKVWTPVDLLAKQSGRIIGVRWLQTGYTEPGTVGLFRDDDDAPQFIENAPRQIALLIATHPLRNPIFVPPDSAHLVFTTAPIRLVPVKVSNR